MQRDLFLSPINIQMTRASGRAAWTVVAVVLAVLFPSPARAQQQSAAATPAAETHGATTTASMTGSDSRADSDLRYRIGPGDVLDIKVFNKPQFNREGVRVDPRGMIRM